MELGSNVLGFVNKVKRADGSPLIPNPDVVARDALIADLRAALAATSTLPLATLAEKAGAVAVFDSRPPTAPPAPIALSPLRAIPVPVDATQAAYESARVYVAGAAGFDATARQEIADDVVAEAQRLTRERIGAVPASMFSPDLTGPANDPPKEPA